MPRALLFLLATVGLLIAVVRPPATTDDNAPDRVGLAAADGDDAFPRVPPTEPDRAEATFKTLHGFRMELLAAEPLVNDPVALEYDENGLAWVVEMRDYPYTDKSTDKPNVERTTDAPLGRVRILADTDGDGRFDRSDIFAEDLSWPTGIALWKGGCYVTATPDVWYLKDTDGDRKADVRRKVFTGFKKLNVQGVINNPRWGLDHKLYCAGASNGGEITKPNDPAFKKVTFGKADFAFDPHTESFEVLTGGARFGHSFDDWGNRFLCNIRNPVQHVLFENRYLARNPYLTVTDAVHDAAEPGDTLLVYRASPPEPWRAARALRYRTETNGMSLPRSELAGEGYFTSACGITIYRGAAYPKEFYGNAFLGEVAGNLIHRQVIEPDGPTFKSRRVDEGAEIVASTDNWFRPVNFTNAPDGTLHVCDMYRETIEHPWSISDDMKAKLDLESGRDRGRIYRLAPPDFKRPTGSAARPQLGKASAAELVASLENPNSWWRDTAHRLIYERQDKACVAPLRKLLQESKNPLARLHALWSLEVQGAIEKADVDAAFQWGQIKVGPPIRDLLPKGTVPQQFMSDEQAVALRNLYRHGLLIAERHRWFADETGESPQDYAFGDDDVTDFQYLLSHQPPTLSDWLKDAVNSVSVYENPHLQTAALMHFTDREIDALLLPVNERISYEILPPFYVRAWAEVIGARGKQSEIEKLLQAAGAERKQVKVLIAGLSEGLRRSRKSIVQYASDDRTKRFLSGLIVDATREAIDNTKPIADRVAAVRYLGQGKFADVRPVLEKLLAPTEDRELQAESVRVLAAFFGPEVSRILVGRYRELSPSIRALVIDALASRADRHEALLDAIDGKHVQVADVPQAWRLLIVRSKDPAIGPRAEKLFNTATGARRDVVERYKPALKSASDPARGQAVFLRECKACHKLRDQGFEVGPNLATVLHRTPDELLTHILDPNREVSPNYVEYVVELDDGRTVTGLVSDDTATGLTLRKAENVRETVLRRNIEAMYATGKSLMPEGLEQKITPQEAADLVAFLLGRK
jgi:putative membrane-bound dehydrogenase-like protein